MNQQPNLETERLLLRPLIPDDAATVARLAGIRDAFEELKLNRVYAHHTVRNPASGKVLEKLGMRREGLLRQRVRKWGVFEDVVLMAIQYQANLNRRRL